MKNKNNLSCVLILCIIGDGFAQSFRLRTSTTTRHHNCCSQAFNLCRDPCNGRECFRTCTVQCGYGASCQPLSCATANPTGCVSGTTSAPITTTTTPSTTSTSSPSACESGFTQSGGKCYKYFPGPVNYLGALLGCCSMGAVLASVNSQADQDIVFSLAGSTGAWLGLSDFLDEGKFSWTDGSDVSFTNWRPGQPNNNNINQHCLWLRTDSFWDDVTCKRQEAYVCQKTAAFTVPT